MQIHATALAALERLCNNIHSIMYILRFVIVLAHDKANAQGQ